MAEEVTVFKRLKWARRVDNQDPVLGLGEVMVDHEAKELRIGNGVDKFSDLTDIVPLDVTQFGLRLPEDFGGLKDDIKNGPTYVSNLYPVGTQIVTTWQAPDGLLYECPWDVVNYQKATLQDGTERNAMILQCHYAVPVDNLQFDTSEPSNTDVDIQTYGSNRYSQSAIRQWLNSDAAAGSWWTAQSATDVAPDYAATLPGFLAGFSSGFVELLSAVAVKTATASVYSNVVDTTYDKVWLPSKEELYSVVDTEDSTVDIHGVEGPYWEYWKTRMGTSSPAADNDPTVNSKRVLYTLENPTTAGPVWLRSATRSVSYYVWYLGISGSLYAYIGPNNMCRATPACAILIGDDPLPEFSDIQTAVRAGTAQTLYPVGTEVASIFTDASTGREYECPWIIVDYRNVETEDGQTHAAAIVQTKYAIPTTNLQFDAPEPSNSDSYRKTDGSNRWRDSAIRQWLNSNAAAGSWWTAQSETDAAPDYATTLPGLLAMFPAALSAMLQPVKVQTATADVDSNVVDTTYDKLWLPSKEELYSVVDTTNTSVDISGVEGPYWEYWKTRMGTSSPAADNDASNRANRITYAIENPASVSDVAWLRSAYRSNSNRVWILYRDGTLSYNYAYLTGRAAPACAIF